jgi:hypothetical protein
VGNDPLHVEFIPAGPGGEIEAHYDEGLDILLFESRRARSWPYRTTIDGILTLDLDADRVLAHVEFGWVRRRWRRADVVLPTPEKGRFAARLVGLTTANLTHPPRVEALLVGELLIIRLSGGEPTHRFPLGRNVEALAVDGNFAGLVDTNP